MFPVYGKIYLFKILDSEVFLFECITFYVWVYSNFWPTDTGFVTDVKWE